MTLPFPFDQADFIYVSGEYLRSYHPVLSVLPPDVTYVRIEVSNGRIKDVAMCYGDLPPQLQTKQLCDVCRQLVHDCKLELTRLVCLDCYQKELSNAKN